MNHRRAALAALALATACAPTAVESSPSVTPSAAATLSKATASTQPADPSPSPSTPQPPEQSPSASPSASPTLLVVEHALGSGWSIIDDPVAPDRGVVVSNGPQKVWLPGYPTLPIGDPGDGTEYYDVSAELTDAQAARLRAQHRRGPHHHVRSAPTPRRPH